MDATAPRRRLSFQVKVLLPVLAAMVLLPAITLWIVDGAITKQVEDEAQKALSTAESVFRQTLDFRAREVLNRFRNAANEPSYRAITQLPAKTEASQATVRKFLKERLESYGPEYDALIFTPAAATPIVSARGEGADNPDGWIAATSALTQSAAAGVAQHATLQYGGRIFLVVALPPVTTTEEGEPGATITVASHVSDEELRELNAITGAEVLLLAGDKITASSMPAPDLAELRPALAPAGNPKGKHVAPVVIKGEHYLALVDSSATNGADSGFRYILLSSYENRLRELATTRIRILTVSAPLVLLGALAVWLVIRRITQPLLELRDSAEAVGRGDFTQRIERFSNDECGDLAEAFNRMTTNLQSSRVDLERAVRTLRTTEAQLIQSEKLSAVGQFVSGIAHELNNPLTAVIGFSELLQRMDIDGTNKNYLDQIARNAVRCHKIVHSLLGFARQHPPERKLVRLNEVVEAVLEIVAYDMRTNNVAIERDFAAALPAILGDAHQLQQVILNILSNARQALEAFRRDGKIIIRTGSTEDRVWLRIRDNGPGIRPDVVSRIFDPFFTTKPQGKGTGLGLSLSYGIVQEHAGTIRVESKPGEGAEFIIDFPIAQTPPAIVAETPADPVAAAAGPKLRVLIVDDEDAILNLVQAILVTDGHQVDTANSGQAALDLCARNPYDVIVSDWKMPGLSGTQVHEDLLARDPAMARRMLFMTGDVVNDAFQEFLKKHSRSCLPKPFSLREFRSALDQLARGKSKAKTSHPF